MKFLDTSSKEASANACDRVEKSVTILFPWEETEVFIKVLS